MSKSAEERFVEGARAHGAGTIEGDAPATNKAYKKLITALREMRQTPDLGEAILADLLHDGDSSVITWSALHLLPTRPNEAMAALQNVANTAPPLISFDAKIVLREWQAGRLKVD